VEDGVKEMAVVVDSVADEVERSLHRIEEGVDIWTRKEGGSSGGRRSLE
jgi:hypothetical protein